MRRQGDATVTNVMPSTKLAPWRIAPAMLQRVTPETPGVKTYEISLENKDAATGFAWQPGQFNMLYLPGVGEAAISISGQDELRGTLQHTIRRVGAVTGALDEGGVGMSIGIRGPFGQPWPVDRIQDPTSTKLDVVLVAGGIGLAPLRAVITFLLRHRECVGDVSILVGARQPCDLLYSHQYANWMENGFTLETTVDRDVPDWNGHVGVVTLLLERLRIGRPESTLLMTCGPEIMMRYVAGAALDRGIPNQNIWLALERNMNCAIGHCGHCQLGPEFICKDGPVFSYDRVAPYLRLQEL